MRDLRKCWYLCAPLVFFTGCTFLPHSCDRELVSGEVVHRVGLPLAPAPRCGELFLPNGISLDHTLHEDPAVLIALWNNALFQELLTDLGIAHADLVTAHLLPNPELYYVFDVPNKPLRYALDVPLEAFWLRPVRIAVAEGDLQRARQRLTQSALDLIRDVRQAYADTVLARGRYRVAQESLRVRGEIAKLATKRFDDGDISKQELATAEIDLLQAGQDATRIKFDIQFAEERLRNLLNIGAFRNPLKLDDTPPVVSTNVDVDALTAQALVTRPDVLAADQAIVAATERVRLAKINWIRFLGITDATSGRKTGHELSPGLRLTIPLFNCNEGLIARAEAELQRAERQRETIRAQIRMEVHQAQIRYSQARAELDIVNNKVRPEVEKAIKRAELAYREGNTAYFFVLETVRQLLDTEFRREQLFADLRRARAELERSVGFRLETGTDKTTGTTPKSTPALPPPTKEKTP